MAAEGATVAVVGRTPGHTNLTVDRITAAGGTAVAVLGDATRDADCRRIVDEVVDHFGHLDVLVNNLGMTAGGSVVDVDENTWDIVMATNLKAVVLMSKRAIPHLAKAVSSSIINVGSIAGLAASGSAAYGTSKGGLVALTREMAFAHGHEGVRVNCLVPGHLQTPMGDRGGGGTRDLRRELSMLGTEGTGWDPGWAAVFLASDESHYITAVTLPVDGGVTAALPFSVTMCLGRTLS